MPRLLVAPLAALLLAIPAFAGAPLFNGSFSNAKDWTVVRGIAFADPSIQHEGRKALLVTPMETSDAYVKGPAVQLTIGRFYELTGYVRTENLQVRDKGRTPIATGASLAMASMPWDVHSESLGGTQEWTRLRLRFVASRTDDNIVLKVAEGSSFTGKAWFEGVSIDEASSADAWPAKSAVQKYGPAYRYPYGGWIYLHVQGDPYERGYQHGRLMAKEIPQYLDRCSRDYNPETDQWNEARNIANALFLRGFDQEILEEMKGIAEGAADAGATFLGRRVDLIDIVTANTIVEMGELRAALPLTPTGLEGLHLKSPQYSYRDQPFNERCSAFAATGKATRDGKMVIAHTTWWPLTLAEQTNVMLDIQPTQGHRVLMQSYPGGIESGTDWYQNDAGVVLTETTIRQSPFNAEGTPVAYRARKAIQYGDNIDKVVEHLSTRNNGLYTNEWLIADAKNDEIAMFELGTYKTKLWRSSKNEWFGGTEGFYWGCNNAKDLNVRLEYVPDPAGKPEHVPYVPTDRDLKWQDMYRQFQGAIDEQFAFLAFRTAPLVSASAMDAKVVTSALASKMMVWAVIGKPNEREWVPPTGARAGRGVNDGLYSSGYRLFTVDPNDALLAAIHENGPAEPSRSAEQKPAAVSYRGKLWKGWVLPSSPNDDWLVAGAAAYYQDLQNGNLEDALAGHWAAYRLAKLNQPMSEADRYRYERARGAILLDSLRRGMGDDRFLELMRTWFAANTTKAVNAQAFLEQASTTATMPAEKPGPLYLLPNIAARLSSALIVYGTTTEAGANRFAAEKIQQQALNMFESAIPIRKDFEVSDAELASHDIIFVGRPETNAALNMFRNRLDLKYAGGSFTVDGKDHASETEGLVLAATNPTSDHHMFLIIAGNSALETVKLASLRQNPTEFAVYDGAKSIATGFRATAEAKPESFSIR